MPSENLIKNITSKDIKLSIATLENMIKSRNIEDFQELCEKSDFIFPFLKSRIIKDFVKLIKETDMETIFEFSKIYSINFEDIITLSLLKFACEDLTDKILNLFETGTKEQKAYCAKYFSKINDSLALEYLNQYALDNFEPLRINCAIALKNFNNKDILEKIHSIITNSKDEFEKLNAYSFLIAYNEENETKFVINNMFSSPFLSNILSNLLDFNDINYLKNIVENDVLIRIYNEIIDEYPENISLDSVLYWNMLDFSKMIYDIQNQYAKNSLMLAKIKFNEFNSDIYTYDLDKNTKSEIKNLSNYLNSIELDLNNFPEELKENNYRYDTALNVIKEYKLINYSENIAQLINSMQLNYEQIAKTALVLKELNIINLIDFNVIDKIENQNIKILIQSYK